jgi:hypothetical protein
MWGFSLTAAAKSTALLPVSSIMISSAPGETANAQATKAVPCPTDLN